MMKVLALLFFVTSVHAYVPTVESLFRHGSNPDISANGISLTFVVKKVLPGEKVSETVSDEYYKVFFTKSGDHLKVAQTKYSNSTYSESSLLHKVYYPNFSAYTIKPEAAEKGVFFALLDSLTYNNGAHMVNYLKTLGVPVRLNSELINREKIEFLADYKRYLVTVSKDRNARKTEVNPLQPEDAGARDRANSIMAESMYTDTKQVKLSKDEGQVAWVMNAGAFEGVASYKERDIQRIRYKSAAGDFEVICKDYWLANGTHAFPRYMLIKTFNGQQYQVEITNLRHYIEKEDDLVKRLKNWDQALKGKDSAEVRPEFLL